MRRLVKRAEQSAGGMALTLDDEVKPPPPIPPKVEPNPGLVAPGFACTMPRKDWIRLLTKAARAAEPKASIPILANLLLRARDGLVEAVATDLCTWIVSSTRLATSSAPGAVCVPAKDLLARIKSFPDGLLALRAEGPTLVVETPGPALIRHKIAGVSAADFPPAPDALYEPVTTERTLVKLTAARWRRVLEAVLPSASLDMTRAHINAVKLEVEPKLVRAITTDGCRLTVFEVAAEYRAGNIPVLLSLDAMNKLDAILPKHDEGVVLMLKGPLAVFVDGDTRLATRIVDAQFPPWQQVVPERPRRFEYDVKASELLAVLKTVGGAANKSTGSVRLSFAPDALTVATYGQENEASSSCAVRRTAASSVVPPPVIGFNYKYLVDALEAAHNEDVRIGLSADELAPMTIVAASGPESYMAVVMPMSI